MKYLFFIILFTVSLSLSAQEADSTSSLLQLKRKSYAGLPILESLRITSVHFQDFGKMVDEAIFYRDPVAIFSYAQFLGSMEKVSGMRSTMLTSNKLFDLGKELVLIKFPQERLEKVYLTYLKEISEALDISLTESEEEKYEKRLKFIQDNPQYFSSRGPGSRGTTKSNTKTSKILVSNLTQTTLYFYIDEVYYGTVYKGGKGSFPISIGCHDLSIENSKMEGSFRALCTKDIKEYNWNIE